MIYIYLDQNHWISIAKAFKRKNNHKSLYELLEKATTSVRSGLICFPISFINILELAKVGNPEQRRILAELMVKLSSGYVVPSPSNVIYDWFKYSIQMHLGFVPNPKPDLVPIKGLFNAFPPEARELLKQTSSHINFPIEYTEYFPNAWLSYLSFPDETNRRKAIEKITKINKEHNKLMIDRRNRLKSEPEDLKFRAYCALLTRDLIEKIKDVCYNIGVNYKIILSSGPEKLVNLITRIPFFDIEIQLHLISEKQWTRKFSENDWYDIGALSIAIPCCDYVFTEKYWKSLIEQKKLHIKYKTTIEQNIARLEYILDNFD